MATHSNPIKLTQQNLKYIRRAHIHWQPNWILQWFMQRRRRPPVILKTYMPLSRARITLFSHTHLKTHLGHLWFSFQLKIHLNNSITKKKKKKMMGRTSIPSSVHKDYNIVGLQIHRITQPSNLELKKTKNTKVLLKF